MSPRAVHLARPTARLSPTRLGLLTVGTGLVLGGCFSLETSITINDDETADVVIATLVDVEQLESLAGIFGEDLGDLGDLGELSGTELVEQITESDDPCADLAEVYGGEVTTREVNEGSRRGVECTVTGVAIDELTSLGDDESSIEIERTGDMTDVTLILDGVGDLTDEEQLAFLEELGYSFDELFDIGFSVSAPGGITTSNATSVDGNTATWRLAPGAEFIEGDQAVMTAQWSGSSSDRLPAWVLVLVVVAALAVAAGVVWVVRQRAA